MKTCTYPLLMILGLRDNTAYQKGWLVLNFVVTLQQKNK